MISRSVCLKLGPLTVHWYGVLMALGFLAGLANWWQLGKREKRDFAFCSDLLFWIMVAGISGARLAYVVANFGEFRSHPLSVFYLHQGGLIYYGGFLGAGLALLIIAWVRHEKPGALFDFVITSVPLAHAFGRVGCFINGCCHGRPCSSCLGVTYPAQSLPWWSQVDSGIIAPSSPHSLPAYPVQLYEAGFNLLLYFVLFWAYRRRRRDGTVLALYLTTYPVARFFLEMLRGDSRVRWGELSVAQWLSIALFLYGSLLWLRALRKMPAAHHHNLASSEQA